MYFRRAAGDIKSNICCVFGAKFYGELVPFSTEVLLSINTPGIMGGSGEDDDDPRIPLTNKMLDCGSSFESGPWCRQIE